MRNPPGETTDRIFRLLKKRPTSGWTVNELAGAVGCSAINVRYHLQKLQATGDARRADGTAADGRTVTWLAA